MLLGNGASNPMETANVALRCVKVVDIAEEWEP